MNETGAAATTPLMVVVGGGAVLLLIPTGLSIQWGKLGQFRLLIEQPIVPKYLQKSPTRRITMAKLPIITLAAVVPESSEAPSSVCQWEAIIIVANSSSAASTNHIQCQLCGQQLPVDFVATNVPSAAANSPPDSFASRNKMDIKQL